MNMPKWFNIPTFFGILLIVTFAGCKERNSIYEYYDDVSKKPFRVFEVDKETGKMDGSYKEFFEDGTLKAKGTYENGELNGSYKEYYENGKIKLENLYKNGTFERLLKVYSEEGEVIGEGFTYDSRGKEEQEYPIVYIGNQIWMAKNMNYETKGSFCYEDKPENCEKYGRLYKWEDAALNACPVGWHLPSAAEYRTLFATIGGKTDAGLKLKSVDGWKDPKDGTSGNGKNSYGFAALPAGYRIAEGEEYVHLGEETCFWSSTGAYSLTAHRMILQNYSNDGDLFDVSRNFACSVRCLRGESLMEDSRDGIFYDIIKIGNQTWMAENLNYETKDSHCYKNKSTNCKMYGRFYAWDAAQKACPVGWHLPSKKDFEILIKTVGGEDNAGKMLKSTYGWHENHDGTDDFGFNALPTGGYFGNEDGWAFLGSGASFWSSTENEDFSGSSFYLSLYYLYDKANINSIGKDLWLSVRCLKD